MRLQFNEAENHLNARPLQVTGPFDVGFLVETRFEFHKRSDRFSRLCRFCQCLDDGRVVRGPVESVCLIATTSGSRAACRRYCTTTSKDSYGWWTMMSFWWIAARQSPPCSRITFGKTGRVGLELEVLAFQIDDLRQVVERKQALCLKRLAFADIERISDKFL